MGERDRYIHIDIYRERDRYIYIEEMSAIEAACIGRKEENWE